MNMMILCHVVFVDWARARASSPDPGALKVFWFGGLQGLDCRIWSVAAVNYAGDFVPLVKCAVPLLDRRWSGSSPVPDGGGTVHWSDLTSA
ncbi:hypothetical protein MATL_G00261020 [Megalops atlanticus]|uniref:Uncharacterized protein n=1 Tax=Megalops atlanticus TaxID=7932 RepID=A0A9D3PBZ1_MEGAT|nr:hypothetical protein MATL_G00261020 [Megalops atlanticus]